MLKFVLFYGRMLLALLGTVVGWIVWRPKLIARISTDDSHRMLRCSLRVARTFKPLRVTGIDIPTEYIRLLGASPPKAFREKARRYTPSYIYDGAIRELVEWSGRLDIARGQTVEVSIPAENPRAVSGTLRICYEYRGLGGVAIMATWTFVPFNTIAG